MLVNFTGIYFNYVIIRLTRNSYGTLKIEYRSFLQGPPGEAFARTHRRDGERAKGVWKEEKQQINELKHTKGDQAYERLYGYRKETLYPMVFG